MIKTIYKDETGLIFKIDSYLKPCIDCGRISPYIVRRELNGHNIWGFRVCWEHLTFREQDIIWSYYHNGI